MLDLGVNMDIVYFLRLLFFLEIMLQGRMWLRLKLKVRFQIKNLFWFLILFFYFCNKGMIGDDIIDYIKDIFLLEIRYC